MNRPTRFRALPAAGACLLALAAALSAPAAAGAKAFLPTLEGPVFSRVRVITADGRTIDGNVTAHTQIYRGLRNITLVDDSGVKHKLSGNEIRQIIVPLDPDLRIALMAEATTTIEKTIRTDYEPIHEVPAMVYDAIAWPKPDKRLLLQRVNPGFDTLIQVYGLPLAKEGRWLGGDHHPAWFGDEVNAYLVVKRGGAPVRIEEDDYRDYFETLFADCPALLEGVPRKERKFRHFADHVYRYELSCR